jgi:hypothetical protein
MQSSAPFPRHYGAQAQRMPIRSMQSTSQSCHKQVSDKKLTGDDKADFIKTCKMAKTTWTGS